MEEGKVVVGGSSLNLAWEERLEEDEEFRSCFEDEDELKEREESVKEGREDVADDEEDEDEDEDENELSESEESIKECKEDTDECESEEEEDEVELDENSVKMYFKGLSVSQPGDSGAGFSGIGVVMDRSPDAAAIQVQKRLDFYVEESLADYFALMDGLLEAIQNKIKRVFAYTNSKTLYDQVMHGEKLGCPLLTALRERVLERANDLETFALKYTLCVEPQRALLLAQVAVGLVSFPSKGDISVESCSICCEERLSSMMMTMKCSHKFCSHCMRTYVEGEVQSSQVPVRCPQPRCKYYISASECKVFLPVTSYSSIEKALAEADILNSDKIYCPYPNCSVLLDPYECSSSRASSSSQSGNSCVECPVCQRFICADCGVPWHSSFTCEEYQNLPLEERDAEGITLHHLAQNQRWKRCDQCRRMIELTYGCYHMTCWCGHEFCYSCGAEYRDGQQMCQCAFWDEDYAEDMENNPAQQFEQWAWDSFESLSMTMDAYSDQERSQLALIQRFLAGGSSLTDNDSCQSPPRCTDSYMDAMKDLQQLPWLERFVSVISDNYYEEYIQSN